MYDISFKNSRRGIFFFFIFLLAGLIFAAIIIGIFLSQAKVNSLVDTTVLSSSVEVITKKDEDGLMYSPVFHYIVDDLEYACKSNSYVSSYPHLDNMNVKYYSKNPEVCTTDYAQDGLKLFYIFLIVPFVFIFIGGINIIKIVKKNNNTRKLNETGKLIKNMPYHLEPSNVSINNIPLKQIVIDYKLPSGGVVRLKGDPRFDRKDCDEDGFVDLLIDEQNPLNYYIDFEINRKSGNTQNDYYNNIMPNVEKNQSVDNTSGEPINL